MGETMIVVKSGPDETKTLEEALRLAAAFLGFDQPTKVVFLDDGVRCLLPGAISDPVLNDYLQAVADLAGIQVLSDSIESAGFSSDDLEEGLGAEIVSIEEIASMMGECGSVVAF